MEIGILYESDEWSSYALKDNINKLGVEAKLINTEEEMDYTELLNCSLVVNRVFASSQFRGHQNSLKKVSEIIEKLKERNIPMVNPYEAHFYEINKCIATQKLEENKFSVPKVYGTFYPQEIINLNIKYPCIIKPNCGGRTNFTYILDNEDDLCKVINELPNIEMIAEEYINPEYGYLTRVEVIDKECKLILKRSVTENGLSAYHLGSKYYQYPECSGALKETAIKAMELLSIEAGSMDIIENQSGLYIIDVNSVSNASEDNIESFNFDLMLETARYIVKVYKKLEGNL